MGGYVIYNVEMCFEYEYVQFNQGLQILKFSGAASQGGVHPIKRASSTIGFVTEQPLWPLPRELRDS
jgi:hypothetical protein